MSDYQIMLGFGAAFSGLSQVDSLGWLRHLYAVAGLATLALAIFNHGHTL